ncbi:MAG TPA: glycosyltransferase family 39 protein [Opitutaceae bacterium]|nr:glycosyltransferase family 39 protein [Opitutaceae bacterium]
MPIFTQPPSMVRETPWRRDLLLLTLLVSVLFGFGLGSYPLQNPDEGRYAEIPREMVATGDFVTPRLNGVKYFEKPPLLYWCVAASEKLFGSEEWTLRLWPAAFALAGVLMTYAAGQALYGRTVGLAGAVVLATSLLYFGLARLLIIDMAVSVLIAGTLFAFIVGMQAEPGRRRRMLFYGLYVCAALATLAKGLIGFLLPGAVMFLWLLIFNEWRRLKPLYLPTGLLIFLAIAAPWHVLAAAANHSPVKEHDFAWFYFVHEHWLRFTTNIENRVQPFWFFAPIVLAGLFPWVAFLGQALRHNLRGGWAARGANSVAWFCVVWAGFIFLFFSASHSKLVPYILPVFPPLALLIGRYVALGWEVPREAPLRMGFRVYGFLAGVLAMALFVVWSRLPADKLTPVQHVGLAPFVTVLVSVLCTGGFLVPWLAAQRGVRTGLQAMVAATAVFFIVVVCALPLVLDRTTKPLAFLLRTELQPGDRVFSYHEYFQDFPFYLGRTIGTVEYRGEMEFGTAAEDHSDRYVNEAAFRRLWAGPGRVFAVARKQDTAKLFADPAFQYKLLAERNGDILFGNQP